VRKEPLRRILKWSQHALFACAVLLLGFCGLVLLDAWSFQRSESRNLDRLLRDRRAASEMSQPAPFASRKGARAAATVAVAMPSAATLAATMPSAATTSAATSGLIGRLEIPRLGLSAVVVEAFNHTNLRRAVGHIPGTALPGESGNVGLAGHRDSFFSPLKDLKINDEIQFSTLRGDFKYLVESLVVVEPDNVGILASSEKNVLTLVTCYPFFYVGPAPKRFIVRARQVAPQAATPSTVE